MPKPIVKKKAKRKPPRRDTRFKRGNQFARIGGLARVAAEARGKRMTAILRDVLENCTDPKTGLTYGVAIQVAMAEAAKGGNVQAFSAVMDRVEGKPVQSVEVSGPGKAPIKTITSDMTLEEKEQAWRDMAAGRVPDTPAVDEKKE